ncbi:MAG: toprim domain-containing protein, partial [Candidatus Limnocylindrus sp.]
MQLLDLVERGVFGPMWSREGAEVKIQCPSPDHDDHNPSCFLNLEKQVFNCFSCGARGHVTKALRWLGLPVSDIAQLELSKLPQYVPPAPPLVYLDDVVLGAWDYVPYQWIDAGLDEQILAQHQIGYDCVNHRITVPIRDRYGRLLCVSGRATQPGQEPRYKIYKTELGDCLPDGYKPRKGAVLWRQHMLPPSDEVIVAEGFKAAMWLVQHGYHSVVATMGKNVTNEQVGLLCSLRRRVFIFFDEDEAGRKGSKELGITLYRSGIDVRYVTYTDGKSPDDLTPCEIAHALSEAQPHLLWRQRHEQLVTSSTLLRQAREGARGQQQQR